MTMSLVDLQGLFFIIGPLRTGSSLMARCVDDHPQAICLCESEINRALFRDYFVELHGQRMQEHGLTSSEVVAFLDRKQQEDVGSLLKWYQDVRPRISSLLGKPEITAFGDKSPDFFQSPELVQHFASNFPLIYTVRDPRAIFRSIDSQSDATVRDKAIRWESLIANYRACKPYLDASNFLIVRFEDLISAPQPTMTAVYSHLGLPDSRETKWSETKGSGPFERTRGVLETAYFNSTLDK